MGFLDLIFLSIFVILLVFVWWKSRGPDFWYYLWTKQIELPVSLWPGQKRSFFLVFRKLTYSPNICGILTVELSKAKEPSTTDSFFFVSKKNVRLVSFSSGDCVSLLFGCSFMVGRSWVRIIPFLFVFYDIFHKTRKTHNSCMLPEYS